MVLNDDGRKWFITSNESEMPTIKNPKVILRNKITYVDGHCTPVIGWYTRLMVYLEVDG